MSTGRRRPWLVGALLTGGCGLAVAVSLQRVMAGIDRGVTSAFREGS